MEKTLSQALKKARCQRAFVGTAGSRYFAVINGDRQPVGQSPCIREFVVAPKVRAYHAQPDSDPVIANPRTPF